MRQGLLINITLVILVALGVCFAASESAPRKDQGHDNTPAKTDKPLSPEDNGDDEEYDSPPKLVRRITPKYTKAAREAKIQGSVTVRLVVGTDGSAHEIKVTEGLDPGLDANAVAAIRRWRFEPAQKDGKPIAAHATLVVPFALK